MSRNLLTSALNYLADTTSVRIAHLIILELPNSTATSPIYDYLTDYGTEITWAGKVYSPDKVIKVGDVRQGRGLTNYKLKVDVAGDYDTELQRAVNDNATSSYVGKTLRVLRAYLDDEGNIIPFDANTNGPMEYFFGNLSDIQVNDGVVSGNAAVTWQCSGKFEDFDLVNGRVTDDASHRGLVSDGQGNEVPSDSAKKPQYQTDTGFQHANQTISLITKYTTKEKRYKMKSKMFGLKSKLKEYEVEVEKELELGVDLSAQYIPYVRGVRRVPGIPVFMDNSRSDPSKIYVVYALCEGPATLLNLYIDGESTICANAGKEETDMCLGDQSQGHTLSKYTRSSGGYQQVHQSFSPKRTIGEGVTIDYESGSAPVYPPPPNLNPVIPSTDPAGVTDSTGLTGTTIFSITNSGGVKRFTYHDGSPGQEADFSLVSLAKASAFLLQNEGGYGPEYWDENSRLDDTAYLVLEMFITESEQSIPEIEAVVESMDSNRSLNPADHLRDYLSNKAFGGGLDYTEINMDSFNYVRDLYNAELTSYDTSWAKNWRYIGWDDPQTHVPKLLECNTLLKTEEAVTKNIESLLKQMDGTLSQLGGQYHLSVLDNSPTIADIDIGEVKGSVRIKDVSGSGKWNSISANIIDPAFDWNANKIVFFDSGYLDQDKGVQKKGNISFNYITNYYVARNWAKRQLDRSRFSREVTFLTYYKYIYLYPNANVTFTYPRMGWDKKKFSVKNITLQADGMVSLTLEESDEVIFADIVDGEGPTPPSTSTNLPRPQNFEFIPADSTVYDVPPNPPSNVLGYLGWSIYTDPNLLRYEVEDWGNPGNDLYNITVPYNRILNPGDVEGLQRVYIPIYAEDIQVNTPYVFKVRIVDRYGDVSKYAILNKTFTVSDLPSVYDPVTGFSAVNTDSEGSYTGSEVMYVWDVYPTDDIVSYEIEFIEDVGGTAIYGTKTIPATTQAECTYTFTLTDNINMYLVKEGTTGAYRDYLARIRGVSGDALRVTEWAYVEEETNG